MFLLTLNPEAKIRIFCMGRYVDKIKEIVFFLY
jgi:hypothetical protein